MDHSRLHQGHLENHVRLVMSAGDKPSSLFLKLSKLQLLLDLFVTNSPIRCRCSENRGGKKGMWSSHCGCVPSEA